MLSALVSGCALFALSNAFWSKSDSDSDDKPRKYGYSSASSDSSDEYYYCDESWRGNINFDVKAERVYYVGCVEEIWDYAPSGKDLCTGEKIDEDMEHSEAYIWLYPEDDRIGRKYKKALFREFTDICFDEEKKTGYFYDHLGAIGPALRIITGETMKIYFKNMCSFPASMHPHGLKYDKTSEGAPYDDGSYAGDRINPGHHWTYIWEAREDSVDYYTSSKMWLYHSHVDEVKDVHTGLIGGIVVTKKGYEISKTNLMPKDVSREYITFMVMYDENDSWLIDDNMDDLDCDDEECDELKEDSDFYESNQMHAINGYLFCNLDSLTCTGGEDIRWYTASFGSEEDGPHSPHWHGNLVRDVVGEIKDTIVIIPGTTETVTMKPDADGKWLYHCHVHDHIDAGMITTYTVDEEGHGDHSHANGNSDDYSSDSSDYSNDYNNQYRERRSRREQRRYV